MATTSILSLCSGIGGLDLGLHAGLRRVGRSPLPICMVEREAFSSCVLVQAMEEGRLDPTPIWLGDLRDLPVADLPPIDLITGGYPCQPFSSAGRRLGGDDPRHLWPAILDLIDALRPGEVFFENVSGHVSLGLDQVLRDLGSRDFRSAFGLFTAAEVGAPHRRQRVFIYGLADADPRRVEERGEAYDDDRDHAHGVDPHRRDEGSPREGPGILADADRDPRGPREPRRASGEVPGEGDRLRGGKSEGEARKEPRSRGPQLADAEGLDRRSGVGSEEEGTGEDGERRRRPSGSSPGRDAAAERLADLGIELECDLGWCDVSERCVDECDACSSAELADSRCPRLEGRIPEEARDRQPAEEPRDGREGMADRLGERLEGHARNEDGEGREPDEADRPTTSGGLPRGWPARPGEEQKAWEPPRTQPNVGRDADGLPTRVDRLRALGNAVCPAQAETAFVTLWEALHA